MVTSATRGLPNQFTASIPTQEQLQEPLPPDALAYAKFYWALDRIGGDCGDVERRSNIELLDPYNGVLTRVTVAMLSEDHPDFGLYKSINELIDDAVEQAGEDVVCGEMYRLLGPSGSLMQDAMTINQLIDPALPAVFAWIAADNSAVPMDAQTVVRFGYAALAHKQAHIFAARTLKDTDPIPDPSDDQYWP